MHIFIKHCGIWSGIKKVCYYSIKYKTHICIIKKYRMTEMKLKTKREKRKSRYRIIGGYDVIANIGHCQDQDILHGIIGGFKVIFVT